MEFRESRWVLEVRLSPSQHGRVVSQKKEDASRNIKIYGFIIGIRFYPKKGYKERALRGLVCCF